MIFLKCKIRFIYVGEKKWGEKMAKTILNFHFDYLIPSLIITTDRNTRICKHCTQTLDSFFAMNLPVNFFLW